MEGCTPAVKSEIDREMDILTRNISGLTEELDYLSERLVPLLKNSSLKDDCDAVPKCELTPLGSLINDQSERVDTLRDRISSLRERLAL